MKVHFLILFLVKVLCEGMILNVDSSLELLANAFENVTRHLFQLETRMFINNYGVDSDTMTSLVLKDLNENTMPFQLKNLQIDKEKILLDSSTLITFNDFASLKEFNQKLKLTNEYFKPLQLFIYCQSATRTEIESLKLDVMERAKNNEITEMIFQVDPSRHYGHHELAKFNSYLLDIIQYEYFVVDETNDIKLLTFVWFSPGKCGELQLIELNKFNKTTQMWENDKFSMKKSANLHGCKIIEAETRAFEVWMISQLDQEVSTSFQALHNATISERVGNRSIDILFTKGCYNSIDRYRHTQENDKSGKGIDVNFITFPIEYTISRLTSYDNPDYYSEYDKLVMPFDDFTWAMIAITFLTAFTTILILYCCVKRSIRDFIIGSNVTTPMLNVIQIFFGIAQVVLPRRNFARFLTMVFILYCLIIRTAWQGKTFEFMQKDIEIPNEQTIDKLIAKGVFFMMEENYTKKYPESEISKRGKVISLEDMYEGKYTDDINWVQQTTVCPFRFFKGFSMEAEKTHQRSIKPDLHLITCGLKLPRHHYLFEMIDHRMTQHFVGDIFMHPRFGRACGNLQWPNFNEKRFRTFNETKVLTLKMLEPGFAIWSLSLLLTIVAFIFEWMSQLKDFLVIEYIFRAFYSTRSRF